jgi:hypothetical protein
MTYLEENGTIDIKKRRELHLLINTTIFVDNFIFGLQQQEVILSIYPITLNHEKILSYFI